MLERSVLCSQVPRKEMCSAALGFHCSESDSAFERKLSLLGSGLVFFSHDMLAERLMELVAW